MEEKQQNTIASAPVARHRVPLQRGSKEHHNRRPAALPSSNKIGRKATGGDLEAEDEREGDRGYDGGGYDDCLRVDRPEQVAAVAVGGRG